ncbi:hypothetical protein OG21DRAFT_1421870, partial [Imleria badia]
FGPITTIHCCGSGVQHIPWTAFTLRAADWERVNDIHHIIVDANNIIQEYFLSDNHPTLWQGIPALEELQTVWESKKEVPWYVQYNDAIKCGLQKISKYYSKFNQKPVYVLSLVLHSYYKMEYIKMAWGGEEEQAREQSVGNQHTKNWYV